jgi:hypothetical protein
VNRYRFLTSCVNADGDDIIKMVDAARRITYRTFMKHAERDDVKRLPYFDAYVWGPGGGTLRLRTDPYVHFARSRYQGRRCYYVQHSAIEYVFVLP